MPGPQGLLTQVRCLECDQSLKCVSVLLFMLPGHCRCHGASGLLMLVDFVCLYPFCRMHGCLRGMKAVSMPLLTLPMRSLSSKLLVLSNPDHALNLAHDAHEVIELNLVALNLARAACEVIIGLRVISGAPGS
eukprot:scaffold117283_cov14-Tisochrysis_lutea.AAC.1